MKRKKVDKSPIVLVLLVLLIFSLLFVLTGKYNQKNSSKKKDKKVSNVLEKKKNEKENYNLKTGEEIVGKSKNNKLITKYMGAYYVDGVMIVNKSYPLDATYKPVDTYKPITSDYLYGGDYLDKTVMENFLKMKEDAKKLGYDFWLSSGYRSYKVQVDLYNNYVNRDGKDAADTYSARPGYSEHQSGLCFDMNGTNSNFLNTEAGKWTNEHLADYGFILRFPEGKEDETGYEFEAWHYRYVGVDLAKKLYNNGNWISLESYLGVDSKY